MGLKSSDHTNEPSVVVLTNGIWFKNISCGQYYSLLLSTIGDIYWFGSDDREWSHEKTTSSIL
jgi:alpha-tubulin suppressor-like RCC1 family protein